MKHFISKIKKLKDFSYQPLGKFVYQFDFKKLEFRKLIPQPEAPGTYARNILLEDPVEVVLLYWPPETASAIHHHEGFYGYVAVLEGSCQETTYQLTGDKMTEKSVQQCFAGGIINEPDGVIHKLANPSEKAPLVTLHIYYPPVESMEDLRIFDIENGRIGVLGKEAPTASWTTPSQHFKEIQDNAFTFEDRQQSHTMVTVKPKPDSDTIGQMVTAYYDEQAHDYDNFDLEHPTRKPYTETINDLIAEEVAQMDHLTKYLSIASGTGRRAIDIRKKANKKFAIYGVDMSKEMCSIAAKKGIFTANNSWLNAEVEEHGPFDVVTFLYGFGHIANVKRRKETLQKIHKVLKPGGYFYFDAFNLEDQNEWGPAALKAYEEQHLDKYGYERGDLFYQKTGGLATAFLHYFTENELIDLVESAGFRIEDIKYIGYVTKSGEIVKSKTEGFFFVKATKKESTTNKKTKNEK